jgi:hypothetical protein
MLFDDQGFRLPYAFPEVAAGMRLNGTFVLFTIGLG